MTPLPDLFSKAAALLQSLARNHALIDGNKRTAWAAAWTFLIINGVELDDFDVDDAETFMNAVATQGDIGFEYVARKLAGYATATGDDRRPAEMQNPNPLP